VALREQRVSALPPAVPTFVRVYCPGCEPDADPFAEILDTRWCDAHAPVRDGADDAVVNSDAFLSGSSEAGGDANRAWCAIIHQAREPRRKRARRRDA
jgi:hypothetical protein